MHHSRAVVITCEIDILFCLNNSNKRRANARLSGPTACRLNWFSRFLPLAFGGRRYWGCAEETRAARSRTRATVSHELNGMGDRSSFIAISSRLVVARARAYSSSSCRYKNIPESTNMKKYVRSQWRSSKKIVETGF